MHFINIAIIIEINGDIWSVLKQTEDSIYGQKLES